ncbi:hypothetical protein Q9233_002555 [Columba guinea]|nr:hypothetical protein Q9233_002555 [Columba guinea]
MSFSSGTEGIFDDEALENVDHVEIVTSRYSEDFSANTQNSFHMNLCESTKPQPWLADMGGPREQAPVYPLPLASDESLLNQLSKRWLQQGRPDSMQGPGDVRAAEHHSQDAPCGAGNLEGNSF